MAIRNTVSIEFVVTGAGLAQLDQISARLRNLGSSATGLGAVTSGLTRLGQAGTTGAAGVSKITSSVHGLGQASGVAGGALQRIGEIIAGTFGGNVLAGAFTAAASAAANFARESVNAALSAEQALTQLRTQSKLTGTDLAANIALAKQVAKEFRISDTDALGIVGSATRAAGAAGRPDETLKFLRSAADLAAAAGRPMSQLQEITRQLASGDIGAEAALDKIAGGKNPSQIYEEFAKSIGTTGDKLDTTQKKLAIFQFTLEQGSKVQGTAQESLNTTTGRLSALGAAYDNIQTKVGKAILDTELFRKGLEGLESAAAALDKPETLAGFQKMSDFLTTIARGFVILSAETATFGTFLSTLWSVALTKAVRFFDEIVLRVRKLANDTVITLVDFVDSLPQSVKVFLGIGGIDTKPIREAAQVRNAPIIAEIAALKGLNQATDAEALLKIQEAVSAQAQAIIAFDAAGKPVTAAPPVTAPAAAAAAAATGPLAALANALNAGAVSGVQSVDFRKVPVLVTDGDSATTTFKLERIAKQQEASGDRIVEGLDSLTTELGEVRKNPPFAKLIVEAGPDTLIRSNVPVGGASTP